MKTFILADAHGTELKPLSERTCKPLLPVAGKPVIAHTLELLYRVGLREATVLAGENRDQLEEQLAGGAPWGMQLDVLPQSGHMEDLEFSQAGERLLLIRGDVLIDLDLGELLDKATRQGTDASVRTAYGYPVIRLICNCNSGTPEQSKERQMALSDTACNALDTLQAYHRANMDVIRGVCKHLAPAGIELSYGIWSEPGATLSRNSVRSGNVFMGAASHADVDAVFAGDVVVGERVLIDHQARLAGTVVLPNTYVGAFTDLSNTIVWGNLLIRVDTGVITEIADRHILADISPVNRDSRRRLSLRKRLLSAWKTCA
jgi:NDP-sugar pyrophosphorylase family protein